MKVIISTPASIDAKKAYDWYNSLEENVGDQFLKRMEGAFDSIKANLYSERLYAIRFHPYKIDLNSGRMELAC